VTGSMLAAVPQERLAVTSVHEPCPTEVPKDTRKANGLVISSLDESVRRTAVGFILEAIRLAGRLGAVAVVVHPGEVPVDKRLEARLRALYEGGEADASTYRDLYAEYIAQRARIAPPHLDAVRRSLIECAKVAERTSIRLGLENRDHYYEIPVPEEMGELLRLAPEQIGYWHDVGHAQKLEHLGFYSQREWLTRFADRMIGVHLHDIDGLTDHIAPGLGSVDWPLVSRFIPPTAIRTFEVRGFTTAEQISAAQDLLHRVGCLDLDDAPC
jgi:sugar phosphate isomerase/epimerase